MPQTWSCPGCNSVNIDTPTDEDLGYLEGYVWLCTHCDKGWEWINGKSQEVVFGS